MRWVRDEIDLLCELWAGQRRKMLGITELQPRDRIGQLKSTLGSIREDRDGASHGTVTQSFPEVYTGDALLVNRAWLQMNRDWRQVIEANYVMLHWRSEDKVVTIKAKEKAAALELSLSLYWKYLTFGKSFIQSYWSVHAMVASEEAMRA